MAGHGVPMVEMPHHISVERHNLAIVRADRKPAIVTYVLYDPEVSVGNAQLTIGCGELHPISDGKLPF